jgi:hypothetical protein
MFEFIEKNHKNIIYVMLFLILLLIYFLYSIKDDALPTSLVTNPPRDLANFVRLINDPSQNVHGVLLLAPNKQDKLVMLDSKLQEVNPCSKLPEYSKGTGDTVSIPKVPDECKSDISNLEVFDAERQVIVLTPGRVATSGKNATEVNKDDESFIFITDLDPSVKRSKKCKHSGGDCW